MDNGASWLIVADYLRGPPDLSRSRTSIPSHPVCDDVEARLVGGDIKSDLVTLLGVVEIGEAFDEPFTLILDPPGPRSSPAIPSYDGARLPPSQAKPGRGATASYA